MSILIAKLSSIGDVIHTLPALSALRESLPKERIGWIIERRCAELLEDHPLIDELFMVDTLNWRRRPLSVETWKAMGKSRAAFREFRATVGLDFQGLYKSALALFSAGAPRRIGFEVGGLKEPLSSFFLTEQVPVDPADHIIRKNLRLIEYLGIQLPARWSFPLPVSSAHLAWAEEMNQVQAGDFAILNFNAGWRAKRPDPKLFGPLSRHLRTKHGLWSIIPCAPHEGQKHERLVVDYQIDARPIPCTLLQFAALASRSKLYVGGDTGLTHIAIAQGTPVVALYGPTEAWRNGPFDSVDVTLQGTSAEPEYYSRRRPAGEYLQFSATDISNAIDRRMDRIQRSAGAAEASREK